MIREATVWPEPPSDSAAESVSLLRQVGVFEPELSLAPALPAASEINSAAGLRTFLGQYQSELLLPIELPAIVEAFRHASRNEGRELILLEQRLSAEPRLSPFAAASQHVGRLQISRLRPLRDLRVVQRYLHAIDNGTAFGWHTVAFGITLAVFSVPLRQGLSTHASLVMDHLAAVAARSRRLPAGAVRATLSSLASPRVRAINALLEQAFA